MPWPGILHLDHLGAPGPQLLHDDAHVLLRHIDHQLLIGLQPLAVGAELGDHPGTGDLELESLAPHGLHQDAEVELAPTGHTVGVGTVGLLHPQRHIALQLPVQAVLQLAAGDVLPIPPGERTVVDDEVHRDGGLLHRNPLHPLGHVHRGEGLADFDLLEPGERHDVAGLRLLDLHPVQPIEGVEPGDPVPLDIFSFRDQPGLAQREENDVVAHPDPSPLDAPDRDPADEAREVEGRDQHLERPLRIALGLRHMIQNGLEQRARDWSPASPDRRWRCRPGSTYKGRERRAVRGWPRGR